jgi:hypothetical protein
MHIEDYYRKADLSLRECLEIGGARGDFGENKISKER